MHLFTRYLLSLAVLFAAVVGGYFFAAFVCYRFTWSENDPLYYLLKVVEQLSPVLIVLLLLALRMVHCPRAAPAARLSGRRDRRGQIAL